MKLAIILVFFTLFSLTLQNQGLGSLSLYYTGGTTFINLRKLSHKASVQYEYKQFLIFTSRTVDSLKEVLKAKDAQETEGGILFTETNLGGNVVLTNTHLSTPLFNSPNGERKHQGWIMQESDFYTRQQESGDIPILLAIQKILEEAPITQSRVRVSVEVPQNATLLRDLLINMIRPENRKDMVEDNHIRLGKDYSNGFVEKLLLQKNGKFSYEPTMDDLYDDFIVRQMASQMTNVGKKAWTMGILELRELILSSNSTSRPNYILDLTAILIASKPDDPISKIIDVVPSNTIQFNEFTGPIDVAVRRAVGIVKATELFGFFVHDALLSQVTYVEKSIIKQLREKVLNDEDIVYKYITWDPESCGHVRRPKTERNKKLYAKNDVVLGFMQNSQHGHAPLIIPGESVMWHQRVEHRFSILAKYNPALINFNMIQLLYNKFFEWKMYNTFCKGSFARSEHLMNVLPPGTSPHNIDIDLFVTSCNKAFPNGWVAKGIWDWNTGQNILHHKVDYHSIMQAYHNSSFSGYAKKIQKFNHGCEPKEDLYSVLRTSPHFLAWKVEHFLADGRDGMVQTFVNKHSEYRVEGYAGRFPMSNTLGDDLKGSQFKKRVNKLFRKCNRNFPLLVRAQALSSDIALLSDLKSISIFETNPGGNCYLIHHDKNLLQKHNAFLKSYVKLRKIPDPSQEGLDPETEMKVIKDLAQQWGVSPLEKWERRFTVLSDRIIDVENYLTKIDLSKINSIKPQEYASPSLLTLGKRYKILRKGLNDLMKGLKHPSDYLNDGFYEFIYGLQLMKESLSSEISQDFKKSVDFSAELYKTKFSESSLIKSMELKGTDFNFMLKNTRHLTLLSLLNVPHNLLRERFDAFFNGHLDKNVIWPRVFAQDYLPSPADVPTWMTSFADCLDSLWRVERSGYAIHNATVEATIKNWIPKLRTLYKTMPNNNHLLKVVTRIIQVVSDYGFWHLNQKYYIPEFSYILSSIPNLKEPTLLGDAIDAIYTLRGDEQPSIQRLIAHARHNLATIMFGKSTNWEIEPHKMKQALAVFKGLIEHGYINDFPRKFAHLVPLDKYVEKLQVLGFYKNLYTWKKPDIKKDEL